MDDAAARTGFAKSSHDSTIRRTGIPLRYVEGRWWTEEPVSRRYFDVVLAGGERAVVFRDEEVGRWFSQRGT